MRESEDEALQDEERGLQQEAQARGGGGEFGIETDTNVLVVQDVYTGMRMAMAYPSLCTRVKRWGLCTAIRCREDPRTILAERDNLHVTDQVSTCLLAAGLPPCCWSFTLTSTCHLLAATVDGESAWHNMHGDFEGPQLPLREHVHLRPLPSRDDTRKFAPRSVTGVFAVYDSRVVRGGVASCLCGNSTISLMRS